MIHRALSITSFVACVLIALSFLMFARDQVSGASKAQVNQLAAATPAAVPTHAHTPGQPRRFIDGVAHTLTAPFTNAIPTDSDWVRHGIPALLGFLVYGVGLGYIARYTRGLT